MSGGNGRKRKNVVDHLGDAAAPKVDRDALTTRPAWWWLLFMPGKVILWLEYMFPGRGVSAAFGTARRRNVPLIQVAYSLGFYIVIGILLLTFVVHGFVH